MFSRRTIASATLGALALTTFAAVPSGAADTEVQFTVLADSSALSVAVDAASATVEGTGPLLVDLAGGASLSDTLPNVTLTDGRGQIGAGWTMNVVGENFVSTTDAGDTVAATNARIYNNVLNPTALTAGFATGVLNNMAVLGGEFSVGTNNLSTSYALLSGTSTGLASGSVTITPTIDITIPAGTQAGTYTGTVSYTAS